MSLDKADELVHIRFDGCYTFLSAPPIASGRIRHAYSRNGIRLALQSYALPHDSPPKLVQANSMRIFYTTNQKTL